MKKIFLLLPFLILLSCATIPPSQLDDSISSMNSPSEALENQP